jgi:hypothetical protein
MKLMLVVMILDFKENAKSALLGGFCDAIFPWIKEWSFRRDEIG